MPWTDSERRLTISVRKRRNFSTASQDMTEPWFWWSVAVTVGVVAVVLGLLLADGDLKAQRRRDEAWAARRNLERLESEHD